MENPQFPGETASCLEFHSTPEQNACWTQFEPRPPLNTPGLNAIVESKNQFPISTDDYIQVDNGTKVPVIREINDRMFGNGSYATPDGDDYYANDQGGTPGPDSWVVRLPVVECQDGLNCSNRRAMNVVGIVCFEIREITITPDKIIRGTFMCPSHPRWSECDIGIAGTGGLDFNIRADLPVLVQ